MMKLIYMIELHTSQDGGGKNHQNKEFLQCIWNKHTQNHYTNMPTIKYNKGK